MLECGRLRVRGRLNKGRLEGMGVSGMRRVGGVKGFGWGYGGVEARVGRQNS